MIDVADYIYSCLIGLLVLADGVLWDVRSGKEIHKFDKFNQCISGVFHPNCLEVRDFKRTCG